MTMIFDHADGWIRLCPIKPRDFISLRRFGGWKGDLRDRSPASGVQGYGATPLPELGSVMGRCPQKLNPFQWLRIIRRLAQVMITKK